MHRRTYLSTAGTVSALGIVGCLGSEINELTTGVVGGTSTEAFFQAKAALVNEKSDSLEVRVVTTDRWDSTPRLIEDGTIDLGMFTVWNHRKLVEGEEPYADIDQEIVLASHGMSLMPFFMTDDSDLTNVEDIEPGSSISPGPGESANEEILLAALEELDIDFTRERIPYAEQATAFQEDRLDVGQVVFQNGPYPPPWLAEAVSIVDLNLILFSDEIQQFFDDDPGIVTTEIDITDDMQGFYANDLPETISGPVADYGFVTGSELDDEIINEYISVLFENREELADRHAIGQFFAEPEFWTSIDEIPYHPGVVDLYEESGAWNEGLDVYNGS